jgi:hypothetical protein
MVRVVDVNGPDELLLPAEPNARICVGSLALRAGQIHGENLGEGHSSSALRFVDLGSRLVARLQCRHRQSSPHSGGHPQLF